MCITINKRVDIDCGPTQRWTNPGTKNTQIKTLLALKAVLNKKRSGPKQSHAQWEKYIIQEDGEHQQVKLVMYVSN